MERFIHIGELHDLLQKSQGRNNEIVESIQRAIQSTTKAMEDQNKMFVLLNLTQKDPEPDPEPEPDRELLNVSRQEYLMSFIQELLDTRENIKDVMDKLWPLKLKTNNKMENIRKLSKFLLLGEARCGKTSWAKRYMIKCALRTLRGESDLIPIFVSGSSDAQLFINDRYGKNSFIASLFVTQKSMIILCYDNVQTKIEQYDVKQLMVTSRHRLSGFETVEIQPLPKEQKLKVVDASIVKFMDNPFCLPLTSTPEVLMIFTGFLHTCLQWEPSTMLDLFDKFTQYLSYDEKIPQIAYDLLLKCADEFSIGEIPMSRVFVETSPGRIRFLHPLIQKYLASIHGCKLIRDYYETKQSFSFISLLMHRTVSSIFDDFVYCGEMMDVLKFIILSLSSEDTTKMIVEISKMDDGGSGVAFETAEELNKTLRLNHKQSVIIQKPNVNLRKFETGLSHRSYKLRKIVQNEASVVLQDSSQRSALFNHLLPNILDNFSTLVSVFQQHKEIVKIRGKLSDLLSSKDFIRSRQPAEPIEDWDQPEVRDFVRSFLTNLSEKEFKIQFPQLCKILVRIPSSPSDRSFQDDVLTKRCFEFSIKMPGHHIASALRFLEIDREKIVEKIRGLFSNHVKDHDTLFAICQIVLILNLNIPDVLCDYVEKYPGKYLDQQAIYEVVYKLQLNELQKSQLCDWVLDSLTKRQKQQLMCNMVKRAQLKNKDVKKELLSLLKPQPIFYIHFSVCKALLVQELNIEEKEDVINMLYNCILHDDFYYRTVKTIISSGLKPQILNKLRIQVENTERKLTLLRVYRAFLVLGESVEVMCKLNDVSFIDDYISIWKSYAINDKISDRVIIPILIQTDIIHPDVDSAISEFFNLNNRLNTKMHNDVLNLFNTKNSVSAIIRGFRSGKIEDEAIKNCIITSFATQTYKPYTFKLRWCPLNHFLSLAIELLQHNEPKIKTIAYNAIRHSCISNAQLAENIPTNFRWMLEDRTKEEWELWIFDVLYYCNISDLIEPLKKLAKKRIEAVYLLRKSSQVSL